MLVHVLTSTSLSVVCGCVCMYGQEYSVYFVLSLDSNVPCV